MQNILFGDLENWKEQALNTNEIIKSIAFMGGLNSLNYFSKLP
jgi:AraC-like DNA-binding protein